MRRILFAALVLTVSACHDYAPLIGAKPKPNSNVRVVLSDSGTLALASYLGPQVVAVRGRFLGRTDSGSVRLAVSGTEAGHDAIPKSWDGENVELPRFAISNIEGQKIALLPTLGVGLGAAALVGGTFTAVTGNGFFGIGGSRGLGGTHH